MSGDATLNGLDTVRGDLKLPYSGAWTAEIELNADSVPTGNAVLELMNQTFRGSVIADPLDATQVLSGESGGWYRCRIIGGAGGLDKPVTPLEWSGGAAVSAVLLHILSAGGETQATTIAPDILAKVLPQWSITRGTVRGALSALCETLSIIWRVLDDGTVWIGTPTTTPITPPNYILTEIRPETGASQLDLNSAELRPGHVFDGLTARQVVYSWEGSQLRAIVTHAPGPVNALFTLFGQWLARVKLDNHKLVAGRISSQNNDNTVRFQPDQDSYAGLKRAAIRLGLPDTEVQINPSSRAVACWEGAIPAYPVLVNFGKSTASKIKVGKSAGTEPTIKATTYRNAESTLNNAINTAYLGLPAAATNLADTIVLVNAIRTALLALAGNYQSFEAGAATYQTTIFEAG